MDKKSRARGIREGYLSGLEERIAEQIKEQGIPVEYETRKICFMQPAQSRTYTPDFHLPNGIIIETKGRFVAADRKKHLLIKQQYPTLDIRFVFSNPNAKLYKGSKTSYAQWCAKHGFLYAKGLIPLTWFKED